MLFKLSAKAAMRMRGERHVAGGFSARVRLLALGERYERDVAFAPLGDTRRFCPCWAVRSSGWISCKRRADGVQVGIRFCPWLSP